MSQLKLGTSGLPLAGLIPRGATIITKQTGNANVPGNTAVLAAFAAAQSALATAMANAADARETSVNMTLIVKDAVAAWRSALSDLGAFTQCATGGEPVKITSAGFEVRDEPTPTPIPGQVLSVNVFLTETPGHSRLEWDMVDRAEGYMIQGSPSPITETSWTLSTFSPRASFNGNGAVAGQPYWYRVAAINSAGQGPWSEPAQRPVM
jgi:hypothetical protein